jgi:hypothetical protein
MSAVPSAAGPCPPLGVHPVRFLVRSGVQPSGVQPSGVRPSVSGRLGPSSGTGLSGRLMPLFQRPAVWCPPARPVASVPSWVSPPWLLGPRRSGPSRLGWVGFRVAWRVPEWFVGGCGGLDAGDAAEVVGRLVGEGAGRDLGRVALGLRRRPRSAADRPGRPGWPGVARRRRLIWARGRATTLRGRCRARRPSGLARRLMSLVARDGRAAPARPSQEVSWPARRRQRSDLQEQWWARQGLNL